MSIRNLDHLFRPSSVAVIGASTRPKSLGNIVMKNLVAGGFAGPIYPVNPHHAEVEGRAAAASIDALASPPDLAVICTPPATVPDIVRQLAELGTRAAVVLTAGLSDDETGTVPSLQTRMLDAAQPYTFRILGPNCVGLQVSGVSLNASFAHTAAARGNLAFVSQSGALCTAMLDWAQSRGIGFSHMVSLGNSADVDFGDVIDYLARDPDAQAIVLYVEAITHARKFMSAARAAARIKPVIAIKAGRQVEGMRAARSHTGALAGADDVYDAAFRRARMLRVTDVEGLFDVVETLSCLRSVSGDRLAILTNGGGPGVLAADSLVGLGGRLAALSTDTASRLAQVLPATWSGGNPVDIIGDAPADRFRAAAEILANAPEVDAILFVYSPTAVADSTEIAQAALTAFASRKRPVFASWLGGTAMEPARKIFEQAGIPTFDTPERAVRAFLNLVEYRRNQDALLETPPSTSGRANDAGAALEIITDALAQGRQMLSEPEAKAILAAYDIPVVRTEVAGTAEEATALAEKIGFPVALKLLSPDITHKSDVGGVVLDLEDAGQVRRAAASIQARLAAASPNARLSGFTVQEMVRRPGAIEIIVGSATDATFGPVLMFGHGGTAAEVIRDRVIGLPPLNGVLARDMISRTRVKRLLAGYRDRPPADIDAIVRVLVKLSELVIDFVEIAEIDINPLLVDAKGAVALDARIAVRPCGTVGLAIRPYPHWLETVLDWNGRRLTIRPIRPDDEEAHRELLSGIDPEDIRFRFFGYRQAFPHEDLARWTQIDYDREMALIATVSGVDGKPHTLGVVRSISDPDNACAEFAILVDSKVKRRGLGRILMKRMIDYLRYRGIGRIEGQILAENQAMLSLMRSLGFTIRPLGEGTYQATLALGE